MSEREEKDERREGQKGFKGDDQMQYNGCLSIFGRMQVAISYRVCKFQI